MTRYGTLVMFLVLLGSVTGCGTMANMENIGGKDDDAPTGGRMYGGVHQDMVWAKHCFEPTSGKDGKDPSLLDQVKGTCYLTVDMPFSFLGDTLTLPLTFLIAVAEEEDSLQVSGGKMSGMSSLQP